MPCTFLPACSSATLNTIRQYVSSRNTQLPRKIPEKWWNIANNVKDNSITSFQINFLPEVIEDLQIRLKNTRKNDYNTNDAIHKFLDYWANSYDFQARERYINNYMHFTTNIQGIDIHYVHVKPEDDGTKQILPLLMLHGWPSSIIEFYKIIPLLTEPKRTYNFIFEAIIPSLPGFGFSSAPTIPGLSCIHMSVILKNLMLRLGHNQFYIQDGDWGIFISRTMSLLFPEHVLGTHSNVCALAGKKTADFRLHFAEINKYVTLSNKLVTHTEYFQIYAIKPETIGIGLTDSPAALATYIIEKFLIGTEYSEINNEFLQKYSYDDLIDNIMIYWTSKSITTAIKTYTEQFTGLENTDFQQLVNTDETNVPSYFSQHLSKLPKSSVLRKFFLPEIMLTTYASPNGRFPALEEPELFADNLWEKIKKWNEHNNKQERNI